MLPLVSEPTVIGDVALDADCVVPPSLDAHVAVKPVMTLLPLPFAVNATIAEFVPRVTPVTEGATGTLPVKNELDARRRRAVAPGVGRDDRARVGLGRRQARSP